MIMNMKKGIVATAVVAVMALVGTLTLTKSEPQPQEEPQLAQVEQNKTTEDKIVIPEEPIAETNTDTIQAEITTPEVIVESKVEFAPNTVLLWPLDGNVVLEYSMDKTIYFSTLDQYKYNPAIVISGAVGNEVIAAAAGQVVSIEQDAVLGTKITMNLGNGYEAIYGQLKDVSVKEGDRITAGSVLGYVSQPTKYYTVEGPNLYFQLLKDSVPVNPMEFFEA